MENPLSLTPSQLSKAFSTTEQREGWLMHLITMGELLKPGAPTLDKMALEALLDLYSEFLDEVGPERFLAAYKLVFKTSKFRPDISEFYRAAGAPRVIPVEREAKDELAQFIAAMRKHAGT